MRKLKRVSIAIMFLLVISMVAPSLLSSISNTSSAEAATTVKINKSKLTLYVGKTYTLKITGTTDTVTWSSSKKTVATVSAAGKVTAKKAGKTTITATVDEKKYTCKVTVKAADASTEDQTTVYGKVTAISGTKVTLALGTMKDKGGTPPSGQPSGAPTKPSDSTSDSSSDTTADTSSTQSQTQPSGQQGEAPDLLTLTGKSITITISDTSILSRLSMQAPNSKSSGSSTSTTDVSSTTAALSDIVEGSILKVTYTTSIDNLVSVQIIGGGQAGDAQSD